MQSKHARRIKCNQKGYDMALTIRTIHKETRKILENFKEWQGIKTDSKALIRAVHVMANKVEEVEYLERKNEKMEQELSDLKRIMAGLEMYLAPALERIQQQELKL